MLPIPAPHDSISTTHTIPRDRTHGLVIVFHNRRANSTPAAICHSSHKGIVGHNRAVPSRYSAPSICGTHVFRVERSSAGKLVQLLVSNLNSVALPALVLQESESGDGKDGEDCDVACIKAISLCPPHSATCDSR
jgi:hypothetical protein